MTKLREGDLVREHEGRHVGWIGGFPCRETARVRWANGWVSDLPVADLVKLTKEEDNERDVQD